MRQATIEDAVDFNPLESAKTLWRALEGFGKVLPVLCYSYASENV